MASVQTRTPDRLTGLPPGVAVGPLGRRLVAHLVDSLVAAVIALLTLGLPGGGSPSTGLAVVGVVLLVVWALVVWWMFATRAAGPGMRLMGLQLVGFRDGRPIGWGRFLVRAVLLAVLEVTVLGVLLMLVFLLRQPRRQGWHDLAADSVVIRARPLAPRNRPAAAAPASAAPAAPVPAARPAVSPTASPADVPPTPVEQVREEPAPAAPSPVAPAPAAPAPTRVTPPAPAPWVAVLDDGRELVVEGLMLLGRNPQPRPGEEQAELVKLPDDSRTVSKSHLALDVDDRGLYVVDRGSTNGSTVTSPEGHAFRCVPGQVSYVGEGSVVSIGDHWLTVRRGDAEAASRDR